MATTYNLSIDQGTDFETTIQVNDSTGSERDLTGYNARAEVRRSYASTANVQFTVSIQAPTTGEILISMPHAKTANLRYGRYVYDVELVNNSNGLVERILEGTVTVYPEVTR